MTTSDPKVELGSRGSGTTRTAEQATTGRGPCTLDGATHRAFRSLNARPDRGTLADRYVADIVRLHDRLSWRGLPDAISGEPMMRLDGYGDGLTTLSVREGQLPERYLKGILGFRLSQFLQLGWMDPQLVHERKLFHEPLQPKAGPDTIHTVTLDDHGRLVGYIAMVGSDDPSPLPLDSAERTLFPAEVAHEVELLSSFAAPGLTTHHVYEIKRFVRARGMERGLQRDRVPWHLILAVARMNLATGGEILVVVGDSTESGALRHLRLLGFDATVVDDTRPSLPRTELMWPSYEKEELAKPWVAPVPDLRVYLDAIEAGLTSDPTGDWQGTAAARILALHERKAA
jgi:hypothetical protein